MNHARRLSCVGLVFALCLNGMALASVTATPSNGSTATRTGEASGAITVLLNGVALQPAAQARMVSGHLYVPLGDILGALGFTLRRVGDTTIATAPSRRMMVTRESVHANLDGVPVDMEQPAHVIGGRVMVPLTFLAVALRVGVRYDAAMHRLAIVSPGILATPGIAIREVGGLIRIIGTVTALDLNSAPPSVTLARGSDVRTIEITSTASVTFEDVAARTRSEGHLSDVRVGDALDVEEEPNGAISAIMVRFRSSSGVIAALSGSALVLDDGTLLSPKSTADISLNGRAVGLADLAIGDALTVRSNPDTSEMREIAAVRALAATSTPAASNVPLAGAPSITSLEIGPKNALRAGDRLIVRMHGTPGGVARFDLGEYVRGIAMREEQPGSYIGEYVAPMGVNFGPTPVIASLRVGSEPPIRFQSSTTVAVATVLPEIIEIAPTDGQTINNPRPSIFATFRTPFGMLIDSDSIVLVVNGQDVSHEATRAPGFVTYSPPDRLAAGLVRVEVRVADRAGNLATRSWTFTIR